MGHLRLTHQTQPVVIDAMAVELDHILALSEGRAIAVVYDWFPPELCGEVAARLYSHPRLTGYDNVPGLKKVWYNTFEVQLGGAYRERYFANAIPAIRDMRQLFRPWANPIDRLRLELGEAWPNGCSLGQVDGLNLFCGQARIFESGLGGAVPHQDWLPMEKGFESVRLERQLTFNSYFQIPPEGGELDLWSFGLEWPNFQELKKDNPYGIADGGLLPPCDVTILPKVGKGILFPADILHAVRDPIGGNRLTVSCFIGIRHRAKPLIVWS